MHEGFHSRRRDRGDEESPVQAPRGNRAQRRAEARARRRVLVHESLQGPHAAGRIEATHDRTERRARDVVDWNALRFQVAEECHVRESPRASAAERQAHRASLDDAGQPRQGASQRKARPLCAHELPESAVVERLGADRAVGDADHPPWPLARFALQIRAGAVAEHPLDGAAHRLGRGVDRTGEEPVEPDAARAPLLDGEVLGRHAVYPREVLGLHPGVVDGGVLADVKHGATATMESVEHLADDVVSTGDDDVAHAPLRPQRVDEILDPGRTDVHWPQDLQLGIPREGRGRHQDSASELGSTSLGALLARAVLDGHHAILRREAARLPACREILRSLQVDDFDHALPRARELGARAVRQGGRAQFVASGVEADDCRQRISHAVRIAGENLLHPFPHGGLVVEDPTQRVPVECSTCVPGVRRTSVVRGGSTMSTVAAGG